MANEQESVNKALIERIEAELLRLRNLEGKVERMEVGLQGQRQSLDQILKTLHHGNGVDPLLTRVGSLERETRGLSAKVQSNNDGIREIQTSIKANQAERAKLRATVISNALMAAASVVAASIAAWAAIHTKGLQ